MTPLYQILITEDETYLKTQSWRKAYLLEEEGYWWRHADSKNKWEFDQVIFC